MWGILADVLSRSLPQQRNFLYLSFALADVIASPRSRRVHSMASGDAPPKVRFASDWAAGGEPIRTFGSALRSLRLQRSRV